MDGKCIFFPEVIISSRFTSLEEKEQTLAHLAQHQVW